MQRVSLASVDNQTGLIVVNPGRYLVCWFVEMEINKIANLSGIPERNEQLHDTQGIQEVLHQRATTKDGCKRLLVC